MVSKICRARLPLGVARSLIALSSMSSTGSTMVMRAAPNDGRLVR